MSECKHLANCPFFLDRMRFAPDAAEVFRQHYCRDQFESCVRYLVAKGLGKGNVPEDLYPHESVRASQLLP